MLQKKPFKYYAIRIGNSIVFRRTVNRIQKVKSILYKPRTEFRLEQVTYTGGKVIGYMAYQDWTKHGSPALANTSAVQLTRERYRALDPYIYKDRS